MAKLKTKRLIGISENGEFTGKVCSSAVAANLTRIPSVALVFMILF